MSRSNILAGLAALLVALAVYALFSLKYIEQPVGKMELFFLKACETQHTDGIPKRHSNESVLLDYQTHLYPIVVGEMFRFLGPNCRGARIAGILFGAVSIVMVFLMIYRLLPGAPEERIALSWLGAMLLATSPASMYGFSSIDIDNGFLVPLYLATVFMMTQAFKRPNAPNILGVAAMVAAMIWAKVMNIPVLIVVPLIFVVFKGLKTSVKSKLILAFAAGFVLFFFTWYLYCSAIGLNWRAPFDYMMFAFKTTSGGTANSKTALISSIALNVLWLNPFFFILLTGGAVVRGLDVLKTFTIRKDDIFPLVGSMLVLGYMAIGGVISGFPRYACPAVPLGCIFLVMMAKRRGETLASGNAAMFAMAAILSAAIYYYLGDLIYLLRFTIRENSALMIGNGPAMKAAALKAVVSFACFAVVFAVFQFRLLPKKPLLIALAFMLGSNIATMVRYQTSGYDVGYQHGGRGTMEAVELVEKSAGPGDKMLLPVEIVYYLKNPDMKNAYGEMTGPELMLKKILNNDNKVFIYSIITQPLNSYAAYSRNPEFTAALNENYTLREVGTYKVWLRKEGSAVKDK